MVGARVRRQQVAYTRSRGLSDRRACAVLSVARSTLGYQSRLVVRDAAAVAAMRRLAAQYPRYGYRRIRIFLRRWCTNRNWHATVPTTGASSTDGVGSWAAHVGHRIQHIARELRFDRGFVNLPDAGRVAGQDPNLGGCARSTRHHVPFGERSC